MKIQIPISLCILGVARPAAADGLGVPSAPLGTCASTPRDCRQKGDTTISISETAVDTNTTHGDITSVTSSDTAIEVIFTNTIRGASEKNVRIYKPSLDGKLLEIRAGSVVTTRTRCTLASAAENPRTATGHLENSSFQKEIPEGWELGPSTAGNRGSKPVFILVPKVTGSTADSEATFSIRATYFPNRVPMVAKLRWNSPGGGKTAPELPRIEGLANWSFYGFDQKISYALDPVDGDVVVFEPRAPSEELYAQARIAFIEILRSYTKT